MVALPSDHSLDKCYKCIDISRNELRIKEESADLLAHLDDWTIYQLQFMGLAPREIKSEMARIPGALQRKLPTATVKALLAGEYPATGFGIGGNTGGGKTMAMAAFAKECMKARARTEAPKRGKLRFSGVQWVSWPDEVNFLRDNAIADDTPARIERLQTVNLLFLDDLGRERIKGNYSDDWAASRLDGIVNHRYRHELPTIWTTNVTQSDLIAIYGAAMLSRLTGDNPLVWVDGLQDMRGVA